MVAVGEGNGVSVGMGVGVGVGRTDFEVTVGGIKLDVGAGWVVSHATKSNITNINSTRCSNNLLSFIASS